MARSRSALAPAVSEASAEAQEREFLEALAAGRERRAGVTIQDLERYAPSWASLVPPDPGTRAALARAIGHKYVVTAQVTPQLGAALALDDPSVRSAFQQRHGAPVDSIYASQLPPRERVRWARARVSRWLEELPPFWTAFALTLTGTVGTTTLALPVAFAWLGPAGGIAVLVGLGLANIVTIAAMAEAMTRSGGMHYGTSYLGRLVGDFLGRGGVAVFTVCSLAAVLFALLVRYVGFGTILAGGTGIPAVAWVLVLFAVNVHYLRRGRFDSTVAAALVIGAVNIALVLGLALLAVPHLVAAGPVPAGPGAAAPPTGGSVAELAFGVAVSAYARHISVGTTAKVVLPRDPGGRSLIAGNVASLAVAIVLYCAWVAAVNGTVPAPVLAEAAGTAVEPYARVAGPGAHVLGGAFAILSMALGSISMSLVLFHTVHEWLPAPPPIAGMARRLLRPAVSMVPVLGIVVVAAWLLVTGQEAFAAPIAFVGTITGPVLSGVFPMLLLLASRRAGEYVPAVVVGPLGRSGVSVVVAGLFLAALFVHVVLWTDPLQRAVTVVAGVATLAVGARFLLHPPAPSLVVELRLDRRAPATAYLTVTHAGGPAQAAVRVQRSTGSDGTPVAGHPTPGVGLALGPVADVGAVDVDLPPARSVRLWFHELTEDGRSVPVAASHEVRDERGTMIAGSTDTPATERFTSLDRPAKLTIRLPAG